MESGHYKFLLTGIIVVQIVGFVALWMRIPDAPSVTRGSVPVIPRANPSSAEFSARIPQDRVLRQAIDSVLKQELAPYLAKLAAAPPAQLAPIETTEAGLPPRDSAPRMQAARQSREIVDRALASGVWTDADSSALLQVAPMLSERQREALLNKIFGAINNQEMKPVGSLPSL